MKLLNKNKKLQDIISSFLDNKANANDINEVGQFFISTLYSAKYDETFKIVYQSCFFSSYLSNHPSPFLRTYHQIQMWIRNLKKFPKLGLVEF